MGFSYFITTTIRIITYTTRDVPPEVGGGQQQQIKQPPLQVHSSKLSIDINFCKQHSPKPGHNPACHAQIHINTIMLYADNTLYKI